MAPRFINVPVDTQIEWPRKEAVITFGQWEIISFPPSRDHDASLHIDLIRAGLSDVEAISVFNQLLSIASWLDDTFAVLLPGWSGNPVPGRPPRQPGDGRPAFSIVGAIAGSPSRMKELVRLLRSIVRR